MFNSSMGVSVFLKRTRFVLTKATQEITYFGVPPFRDSPIYLLSVIRSMDNILSSPRDIGTFGIPPPSHLDGPNRPPQTDRKPHSVSDSYQYPIRNATWSVRSAFVFGSWAK